MYYYFGMTPFLFVHNLSCDGFFHFFNNDIIIKIISHQIIFGLVGFSLVTGFGIVVEVEVECIREEKLT